MRLSLSWVTGTTSRINTSADNVHEILAGTHVQRTLPVNLNDANDVRDQCVRDRAAAAARRWLKLPVDPSVLHGAVGRPALTTLINSRRACGRSRRLDCCGQAERGGVTWRANGSCLVRNVRDDC